MGPGAKDKVLAIGALAAIAAAVFFIVRQVAPERPRIGGVDWVCEDCDYRFVDMPRGPARDCPKCRGEAVKSWMYYDAERNEVVELYREKTIINQIGDDPADPASFDIRVYYKKPGGEWYSGVSPAVPAGLAPALQDSEYRK